MTVTISGYPVRRVSTCDKSSSGCCTDVSWWWCSMCTVRWHFIGHKTFLTRNNLNYFFTLSEQTVPSSRSAGLWRWVPSARRYMNWKAVICHIATGGIFFIAHAGFCLGWIKLAQVVMLLRYLRDAPTVSLGILFSLSRQQLQFSKDPNFSSLYSPWRL
jgi:hypothetical protein